MIHTREKLEELEDKITEAFEETLPPINDAKDISMTQHFIHFGNFISSRKAERDGIEKQLRRIYFRMVDPLNINLREYEAAVATLHNYEQYLAKHSNYYTGISKKFEVVVKSPRRRLSCIGGSGET